jgi:hypothetical protein
MLILYSWVYSSEKALVREKTMRIKILFLTALTFLNVSSFAQDICVPVPSEKIIRQGLLSENACGPAAILNALQFGNENLQSVYQKIPGESANDKLIYIADHYGKNASVVEKGKTLFGIDRGMMADDILPFFNAILGQYNVPQLQETYGDLAVGESTMAHLRRMHGYLVQSIRSGVPVVASIRSFATQKDPVDGQMKWQGVAAHVILITKVPGELQPFQKGFNFEFIDPSNGTVEEGYLHIEDIRGFAAIKGSGSENFQWLDGSPFLLAVLPSLNLDTNRQEWSSRTLMTLNYIVGSFQKN